ncbi:MAG: D-alanine--D-alanine ligase [Planctomycetota bacterium]|nr:D-alanine--D-alanine ligase [Planctomycetota bacterium]MDA1105766.1 D-alanine--D-alanine ligase [Planctomycetota bacterium]
MPLTVLVLRGGPDAEREVSLKSGSRVAEGLRTGGRHAVNDQVIERLDGAALRALGGDVIAPIVHGPWGEGGDLQELLEADGRPYLGAGPAAARVAMDKVQTKVVGAALGIPTPQWQVFRPGDRLAIQPPVVIKPIADGSSVDLFLCHDAASAEDAAERVARRRGSVLVERLVSGREVTVGILGSDALPIIEIIPAGGTYDYDAKYLRDDTVYRVNPNDLGRGVAEQATRDSLRLAQRIGCRDLARVDFLVADGVAWLLEINTMPGMTDHSLVPKAAESVGLPFPALCTKLIDLVMARVGSSRAAEHAKARG